MVERIVHQLVQTNELLAQSIEQNNTKEELDKITEAIIDLTASVDRLADVIVEKVFFS